MQATFPLNLVPGIELRVPIVNKSNTGLAIKVVQPIRFETPEDLMDYCLEEYHPAIEFGVYSRPS